MIPILPLKEISPETSSAVIVVSPTAGWVGVLQVRSSVVVCETQTFRLLVQVTHSCPVESFSMAADSEPVEFTVTGKPVSTVHERVSGWKLIRETSSGVVASRDATYSLLPS